MKNRARVFAFVGGLIAAAWVQPAAAAAADYAAFKGQYSGHETFHYPSLRLEGHGSALLKISASAGGGGAVLAFNRSLRVGEMVFPFSELTRFSSQGKFSSRIFVSNFARFGTASGQARVTENKIRFTASYPMLGTSTSLVEAATITVRGRELTYRVVVEFATGGHVQKVATFVFTGRRGGS
jgi:hypothetical protein